jgi:hypothetical protein
VLIRQNNYINTLYETITGQPGRKKLIAVHLADPHVDYNYVVGSDNQCSDYLCCRANNGFPTEPSRKAGPWGSYMCDVPPNTLELMFKFMRTEVRPDIIFWTGDNSPHVIWSNTKEEVVGSTVNITKMIKEAFFGTNVTVYPIQGNHDTFPANS